MAAGCAGRCAGIVAALTVLNVPGTGIESSVARAADKCRHADQKPAQLKPGQAEAAVKYLVNKRRVSRGRSALKEKGSVSKAAARHSGHMISTGCFDHDCPGEPDLSGRVHSVGYLPCNCSWQLAENIAWGDGRHGSAKRIVKSWIASPGHRRNILTARFTDIGAGFLHGRPGSATRSSAMYTLVLGDKN